MKILLLIAFTLFLSFPSLRVFSFVFVYCCCCLKTQSAHHQRHNPSRCARQKHQRVHEYRWSLGCHCTRQKYQRGMGRYLPRRPPENDHQMATGAPQQAHFEHFHALATNRPQEAPRRLILSIFPPWPPGSSRCPSWASRGALQAQILEAWFSNCEP